MAIALRAAQGSNNAGGATSITMTVPSGVADGDVMVAAIAARGGSGTTLSVPAVWTGRAAGMNAAGGQISALGSNGSNLFVAGGTTACGGLSYSADGLTWTFLSGAGSFTTQLQRIAYGDGLWVALGTGQLATSSTGTSGWTRHDPSSSMTAVRGLATDGAGLWMAGGFGLTPVFRTSSDPTTTSSWTLLPSPPTGDATECAYADGYWLCATQSSLYPKIYKAADPTGTWTEVMSDTGHGYGWVQRLAYDSTSGRWVALTYGGIVYVSSDEGGSWSYVGNLGMYAAFDVAGGAGSFVAVGQYPDYTDACLMTSPNGTNWTTRDVTGVWTYDTGLHRACFQAGTGWVVAGEDDGFGTGVPHIASASSVDGWTALGSPLNSGTDLISALYWKSALTEPASYAFSISPSRKASGVILALSGGDTATPAASQYGGQVNGSSATVTSPALTLSGSLVGIEAAFSSAAYGTTCEPVTLTEPANGESAGSGGGANSRTTTEVEYGAYSGSAPPQRTATMADAAVNIGFHVFIKELDLSVTCLPTAASLSLTASTPVVAVGGNQTCLPGAAALTLTAATPDVALTSAARSQAIIVV